LEKTMRNTWKGMMLGALSGAAVGLALDAIDRAAHGAGTAVHAAPDAAARAGGSAARAGVRARPQRADRPERAIRNIEGSRLSQRFRRRPAG
jgi:hypothetical protein